MPFQFKKMTEAEAKNDPKMIIILLLSGFWRELKEGADLVEKADEYAERIMNLLEEK